MAMLGCRLIGLNELAPFLSGMDIILAEGFKRSPVPKLEIFRPEAHKEPICRQDPNLMALISDAPLDWNVPRFGLDDVNCVADFLIKHFKLAAIAKEIQQVAAS